MYKRNKNIFFVFWARRGLILALTYLHVNGESGLRSSSWESYLEKYLKNDLIFFSNFEKNFIQSFSIILLFVSCDASNRTDNKNNFFISLNSYNFSYSFKVI